MLRTLPFRVPSHKNADASGLRVAVDLDPGLTTARVTGVESNQDGFAVMSAVGRLTLGEADRRGTAADDRPAARRRRRPKDSRSRSVAELAVRADGSLRIVRADCHSCGERDLHVLHRQDLRRGVRCRHLRMNVGAWLQPASPEKLAPCRRCWWLRYRFTAAPALEAKAKRDRGGQKEASVLFRCSSFPRMSWTE